MHPNLAGSFSAYVLRAIQAGASMPPMAARIAAAAALLIAIPLAIAVAFLALLSAAVLLVAGRFRRAAPPSRHDDPVVIEGEYTVIAEPHDDSAGDARRVSRRR